MSIIVTLSFINKPLTAPSLEPLKGFPYGKGAGLGLQLRDTIYLKMNYNVINDYLIKLPTNHPYNKPKLNQVRVIVSNNNLAQNSKLLVPLINTSLSITGQYPSLILANKSVASFKVRKGSPIGLLTTLTPNKGLGISQNKVGNFLKLLNIYYLPKVISQLNLKNLSFSNLSQSSLTLGVPNINIFSYITPLSNEALPSLNKNTLVSGTGGYIQMSQTFTLPKHMPVNLRDDKQVLEFMHKYFYSINYFPFKF